MESHYKYIEFSYLNQKKKETGLKIYFSVSKVNKTKFLNFILHHHRRWKSHDQRKKKNYFAVQLNLNKEKVLINAETKPMKTEWIL